MCAEWLVFCVVVKKGTGARNTTGIRVREMTRELDGEVSVWLGAYMMKNEFSSRK